MTNSFPAEPFSNQKMLTPGKKSLKICYGANAWGRSEWMGEVYPAGTKEKDFLKHYAEHFNSIEFNATHYQIYTPLQIKKWADSAENKDFFFCPKFPQTISHYSAFTGIEDKTNYFLDSLLAFGKHLGPVLLQLGDKLSPRRKDNLYTYLENLPRHDFQFFLEVRNPGWFEEGELHDHHKFLRDISVGSVIHDAPDKILHVELTVAKCIIKYSPAGDFSGVKSWFDKINEWGDKGLTEAYFFVQPGPDNDRNVQLKALQYFKQLVTQQ